MGKNINFGYIYINKYFMKFHYTPKMFNILDEFFKHSGIHPKP